MSTQDSRVPDTSTESPETLLEDWAEFVEGCEQGYEYNVMEYHADLAVRDRIEACLRAPGRTDAAYAARVAEVDDRFRALLQPGVEVGPEGDPWWHRGVLRYAGYSLADGLREWFSVEVEARG
jgi:hypothetical protein